MKLVSNIKDIPELNKSNIKIRNPQELLVKLNKLIQDGHSKLQIITDFDYTLTKPKLSDETKVYTSFGMFQACPSIPQHYKDEDQRLGEIYKPIEVDPLLSVEEKTQHMVVWYTKAVELLKGNKFPRQELEDIGRKMKDCFRSGVGSLISWSESRRVPVLVLSAGIGESVEAALAGAGFLRPHVKVVSNFLQMEDNDIIVGTKGDVIHTYNKNETAIKDTDYYQLVVDRSNVLLMGDHAGDAQMAAGMEHCDVIIKLGFLGANMENNLSNHLKNFDIVLVDDNTMDVANAILELVL